MTLWIAGLTGLLATSLVAGPIADDDAARSVQKPEPQDADVEATVEETVENATPVDEAVQEAADEATAERRKKIIDDAVQALDETYEALKGLDEGRVEDALDSLAVAAGKLDLVVARNPRLALAPVDVRLATHDLYATVEAVEAACEEAADRLEDGRVQEARHLIEGLRSDVVVEVVNLPLASYPSAIKAITPLIDDGRIEEAKVALQRALNTLVITQHIYPLPVLRTDHLLTRADELAATADRSEEQEQELERLLEDARRELELAEALGYGSEEDFSELYGQLDEIARNTSDGKSGSGFFDRLRKSLRWFDSEEA